MKFCRIGDPHATISNMSDCEKLIDFIISQSIEHKVDRIEFMGDLLHTHAVIRSEVLDFWRRSFAKIVKAGFPIITLVGNHDQVGSREKEQSINALDTLGGNGVLIVNKPMIEDNIAYIPHMSDHTAFLKASANLYAKGATETLMAHQNFVTELFGDMIDSELVAQAQIISGHIHTPEIVGKCFNTGTPKWDTLTDANDEKGIWIMEHSESGVLTSTKFISTREVVTPITRYIIKEGDEVPNLSENARNYLEFHGKTAWISKMKKKYKGKARIKGRPSDRKIQKLDSEKTVNLEDFLNNQFVPIEGVKRSDIQHYIRRISDFRQGT